MSRPSRIDQAKQKLHEHYSVHGGMPSVQAFAEMMGYASTSSAHDVTKKLVEEGFLAKDERGGRLLPGASLGRPRWSLASVPTEVLRVLPADVPLSVVKATERLAAQAEGILAGDFIVLAPADRRDLSATLLVSKGPLRRLAAEAEDGWSVVGVVVAQFRPYGR